MDLFLEYETALGLFGQHTGDVLHQYIVRGLWRERPAYVNPTTSVVTKFHNMDESQDTFYLVWECYHFKWHLGRMELGGLFHTEEEAWASIGMAPRHVDDNEVVRTDVVKLMVGGPRDISIGMYPWTNP